MASLRLMRPDTIALSHPQDPSGLMDSIYVKIDLYVLVMMHIYIYVNIHDCYSMSMNMQHDKDILVTINFRHI